MVKVLQMHSQWRSVMLAMGISLALPIFVAQSFIAAPADARRKKRRKKKSTKKKAVDVDLGKKRAYGGPSVVKEKARAKLKIDEKPSLSIGDFRARKELEKKGKIEEQLRYIDKIIGMNPGKDELPGLLFQKGELYLEQSQFYFFTGMALDDKVLDADDAGRKGEVKRLKKEKKKWIKLSKKWKRQGVEIFSEIVDDYPKFDRLADVIYSIAQAYWDENKREKSITYYRKLITQYPDSQFIPDAWLAFGEFYFAQKKLDKALQAYQRTATFEESKVFAYAVYKQGWCYYNKGEFAKAGEKLKEVVLYSQLNPKLLGARKITLAREARKDFVLTYSNYGDPRRAISEFKDLSDDPKEQRKMLERLAGIYFGEGKDREAIVLYRTLMAQQPDNTRNPFFQARIVTCAKRLNDKRFVVKMARALVDQFKKVRAFAKAHGQDKNIDKEKLQNDLIDAEDLSDNTLRVLATTWHNEARKTKDDDTFEMAYELYGDYLNLFPNKKPAYEIRFFYAELLYHLERFEKAGDEYTKVFMQKPKKGKWAKASAEEAVRSYDEAVQDWDRANKRAPLKGDAALKPIPVPKIKKKLIAAAINYLKYNPKGEIAVEAEYKIARILYEYNNFDQAAERFLAIVDKYPDSPRARQAANLTLDIYNLRQQWKEINKAARAFSRNRALTSDANFRKTLSEILESSSFKLIADEFEAKEKYAQAAKKYLLFVREFPKSELADKAMVNAASNYLKAGKPEESIQVRLQFVKAYPKSPLVPDSMYAVAESYEQVVDYKQAANWLEKFVKLYPKDPRSKDALFNASIYREGLEQFSAALKTRQAYLKKYPKVAEAGAIYLSIAGLYRQMRDYKKAANVYLTWGKKYAKDKDAEFDAKFKAVDMLRRSKKTRRKADQLEASIFKEYRRMGKRGWKKFKNTTDAQARMRFALANDVYAQYKKQKIEYPRKLNKRSIKKFQKTLKAKVQGKDKIKGVYVDVVKLGRPFWAIASLAQIGDAHLHLVKAIVATPAPKGLTRDQADMFKDKLREQTFPIEEAAGEAFKLCVDKSVQLNMFNKWTQKCINYLEENRPDAYPKILSDLVAVKALIPYPKAHGLVQSLSTGDKIENRKKIKTKKRKDKSGKKGKEASQ